MLLNDDHDRQKWERITAAGKYAQTVVSIGPWKPPAGRNAGDKISYNHVPTAEDFW